MAFNFHFEFHPTELFESIILPFPYQIFESNFKQFQPVTDPPSAHVTFLYFFYKEFGETL